MFHNLVNKYPTESFIHMDNILITTKNNINHHRQIIDDILELLAKESYFLQPSKCVFEQTQIEYLRLITNGDKLSIDPIKADGLQDWPRTLTKVKQVQSVLGLLGYQQPFIPNYVTIARPLQNSPRKTTPFHEPPNADKP